MSKITKSCDNCMDQIVCWAYDKLKSDEEAKKCPDWHLDFMEHQNQHNNED